MEDRELIDGAAGCPVCQLEARVAGGVVRFAASFGITLSGDPLAPAHESVPDEATVLRTGALLALAEPGGAVLLTGHYARLAAALRERFGVTTVVAVTPGAVPFTDQTFRAAALDADVAGSAALDDAVRTVAVGGRVLLPAGRALPPGLRVLAADERETIAEREAPATVISLGRAAPPRTTSR